MPMPKGHKDTPETLEKKRLSHLGKRPSTKTILKLCRAQKRENNPMWKGGRQKQNNGYILINCENHPYSSQRNVVLEHRLIMEKYLGRYLTPKEEVHHENHIRNDNRIENLVLFSSKAAHTRYHRGKQFIKDGDIIFHGGSL